ELLEELNLVRKTQRTELGCKRCDVTLDELNGLFCVARECHRGLIGIRHHRPIGRIGGLLELHVKIRRQPARLVEPGEEGGLTSLATESQRDHGAYPAQNYERARSQRES